MNVTYVFFKNCSNCNKLILSFDSCSAATTTSTMHAPYDVVQGRFGSIDAWEIDRLTALKKSFAALARVSKKKGTSGREQEPIGRL